MQRGLRIRKMLQHDRDQVRKRSKEQISTHLRPLYTRHDCLLTSIRQSSGTTEVMIYSPSDYTVRYMENTDEENQRYGYVSCNASNTNMTITLPREYANKSPTSSLISFVP